MSGEDDYLVTVMARDLADFERIHKEQLSRLPGCRAAEVELRVARRHQQGAAGLVPVALAANVSSRILDSGTCPIGHARSQ